MKIAEVASAKSIKPQTPEQTRIAALKNNLEQTRTALDAERKRQQVSKAQRKLRQVTQY